MGIGGPQRALGRVWYDDRDFPGSLNTFHIYATHSTDDGATWTGPDEQVTDAATNLNVGHPHRARAGTARRATISA